MQTNPVDPSIPPYYHRHAKVFDEKASQRFPPACEEDHVIQLKPDAPPSLNCKVYPQTKAEAEATKEFIDDHVKKGYIVESNSPYASPFCFRTKRDGKLRPIMDYRVLNSFTVRDNYPLPLINTILDQLQGKELFTKFDICWGYNNIRIKEEDQWKAAFKMPFSLYQPRVMFFGLTNSPATFCRTMARLFRDLTNSVTIPPPVGPTVRRVAYIIRIGLCPRVVQRTRLVSCGLVVTGRGLISYVLCCVSCVVSRRCLHTTESDSACLMGVVLVRVSCLVIMRVGIRLHGISYP